MDEVTDEKELSPLFKGLISRLKNTNSDVSSEPVNRISIKGGVFTCFEVGAEPRELQGTRLEIVVVNAAPVSRTYYPNSYDPDNPSKPSCWSSDTRNTRPDEDVPNKQSVNCLSCERNVKGSGQGMGRACRFHQRIALSLIEDGVFTEKVFQLQLPATSVFGKDPKKMSMQAYLKHLNAHNAPLVSVVTSLSFDKTNDLPRLVFNPVRALTKEELALAVELKNHSTTQTALVLSSTPKSPFSKEEGFIYATNEDHVNGR